MKRSHCMQYRRWTGSGSWKNVDSATTKARPSSTRSTCPWCRWTMSLSCSLLSDCAHPEEMQRSTRQVLWWQRPVAWLAPSAGVLVEEQETMQAMKVLPIVKQACVICHPLGQGRHHLSRARGTGKVTQRSWACLLTPEGTCPFHICPSSQQGPQQRMRDGRITRCKRSGARCVFTPVRDTCRPYPCCQDTNFICPSTSLWPASRCSVLGEEGG